MNSSPVKDSNDQSLLVQARQLRSSAMTNEATRDLFSTTTDLSGGRRAVGLKTSWKPFSHYLESHSERSMNRARKHYGIEVETAPGSVIPPMMSRFSQMRLPSSVLEYLKHERNILKPTGIQMQGIPTVLSGRDLIGIAYTGSGKSLVFCLPMVLFAIEAESSLEFVEGEGPLCLIVVPSRELAKQIHEQTEALAKYLHQKRYPRIKSALCIGGTAMAEQAAQIKKSGTHIVVATPGRLLDLLEKGILSLETCKHFCLDEADRMVDLGFETELRRIIKHFPEDKPRQTLLFSATMPSSIKEFARSALVDPVFINVGRAGAASKTIEQTVEWVPLDARPTALLEALQKTAPPVLIFSQSKWEVNEIQGFLLRKGVEAVAIHGSKTQEERTHAIEAFKKGQADVLVATDVASKGLDFPDIQHVINYDMPAEIEDYVHRIGRTGRGGKAGLATTFVNSTCTNAVLLDLMGLLLEAGQVVPTFLREIGVSIGGGSLVAGGCPICGGLGHAERNCPKLSMQTSKAMSQLRGADGDD